MSTVILPISAWTSYTRPTGWVNNDTGCYESDTSYKIDETALKGANLWASGQDYWLTSHFFYEDPAAGLFFVMGVGSDGGYKFYDLCRVDPDGRVLGESRTSGFRPCISLKSDIIKIIKGEGTPESPYVIRK